MAVTTQYSTEYNNVYVAKPSVANATSSWHGRLRGAYFAHTQSGAGDATSNATIFKIPPGSVRLILPQSFIYINWTTGSATVDIGWGAYTDLDGSPVDADPNGLVDGLSVESADVNGFEELTTLAGLAATGYTKLFQSKEGVDLILTSQDTAIADGDTAVGMFTYMQD